MAGIEWYMPKDGDVCEHIRTFREFVHSSRMKLDVEGHVDITCPKCDGKATIRAEDRNAGLRHYVFHAPVLTGGSN